MRTRPKKTRLDRCGATGCRMRGRAPLKITRLEDLRYTSGRGAKPCRVESKRCPVQLVFVGGRTFLRTCASLGVVEADTEVETGVAAQKVAKDWCSRRRRP